MSWKHISSLLLLFSAPASTALSAAVTTITSKKFKFEKKNYSPLPNWLAKSPTYLQNYFNMTGTMKNILVRGHQLSLLLSKQHAKIGSRAIMSSASVRGLEIPSAKWVMEFWIQLYLKTTLQARNINIFFVILPCQSECYFILVKTGYKRVLERVCLGFYTVCKPSQWQIFLWLGLQ